MQGSNLKLGNVAFREGRYEEAIQHYLKAKEKLGPISGFIDYSLSIAKRRLNCDACSNSRPIPKQKEDFSIEVEHAAALVFDACFYLDQNPDVKQSSLDPEQHYYQFGEKEGRWPNQYFDPRHYLKVHEDVRNAGYSPFRHYMEHGYRENREIREITSNRLIESKKRGTFLLVTHDTDVGGAQHLLGLLAGWIKKATRFDVQIISVKDGNLRHVFDEIAPLIVLHEHPEDQRSKVVSEWISPDVRCAFVNSIASAEILNHLPKNLPVVAFIHELPKVLNRYPEQVELVRSKACRVIGGGPTVSSALVDEYGFEQNKVSSSFSFIESLPPDEANDNRRALARHSLGIPHTSFLILGCGVLHWRKSPDKFIEVAERVLSSGLDAHFLWIGGGPDKSICDELVLKKGLQERVRFTGYEPRVAEKLAGGDLFLLSSQEDPYPLVALYAAQAGMPIVCFQNAGGIESFVSEGSGIAVPFMDVDAMAYAILAYAKDSSSRKTAAQIGQKQVRLRHTIDVAGPVMLNHLREAAGIEPEVSVIVPNYNYLAYLPERLTSIATQRFQDFEVILLDDASSDGSQHFLEEFTQMRPGSQLLINQENTGSPFLQWMRGMETARAELIWLAEADDRCTPDFLEKMLPFFDDRNVRIASCASQPVTEKGDVIGDYRQLYLNRIAHGRWDDDYIATDHEEANEGLGIANSFPNASAVIFRKFTPEPKFVEKLISMRLCGDWYFYVRAMRGGLVGFSASLMNDHRRHGNTVTHQLEGSLRYFEELAIVRDYLARTYKQSEETCKKINMFFKEDVARFKVDESKVFSKLGFSGKQLPCLLVVTPDLSLGGGQTFAISVANEWMRRGGRVILLNVANQPSHPAMLEKIASEVMCIDAYDPCSDLGTLIKRFNIEAIHSNIWWADRWVDNNRIALPLEMPWVITMHGCHETLLHDHGIDPSFPERMQRMIARASWAYIADKNLSVFDKLGYPDYLIKIANGVAEASGSRFLDKATLGLRPDAVVLCLASRAIRSKGWAEAIRLTERLNSKGQLVDLILLGDGPDLESFKESSPNHVHFLGQVTNTQAYFELADIGLLPSYFVGESMPLVLLEMMAKSLPLLATNIGEIPNVIGTGEDAAGLIVPLSKSGIDEDALYAAALKLLDPSLLRKLSYNARARYKQYFTLDRMVDRYQSLYSKPMQRSLGLFHPGEPDALITHSGEQK